MLTLALWVALLFAPFTVHGDEGTPTAWRVHRATAQLNIGQVELRYEPKLRDEAQALARLIPHAWQEVERAMAVDLDDALSITLFDHAGRVADATGMPRWVAGVAHPSTGEIMIARHGPDGGRTQLGRLLKHEMAHVALHRATGGAATPRWFREGIAETFEGGINLARANTLVTGVLGGGVPDLNVLERRFYSHDGQDASVAYATARDLVEYLRYRDANGEDLRQVMTELKAGQPFEAAWRRAYGVGLSDLVKQWHASVAARFAWLPLLVGGMMPVGILLPLLVVAWFRRRRVIRAAWARLEREDMAATEPAMA